VFGRDGTFLFNEAEFAEILPHKRITTFRTFENQSNSAARHSRHKPSNMLLQHPHYSCHCVHIDGKIGLVCRSYAKPGKGWRLKELRYRSEIFWSVNKVSGMKRGVGISIYNVPQLAPLRFHRVIVSAKDAAASDGVIWVIPSKSLMAGFVHEKQKPVIANLQFFPCLHTHAYISECGIASPEPRGRFDLMLSSTRPANAAATSALLPDHLHRRENVAE